MRDICTEITASELEETLAKVSEVNLIVDLFFVTGCAFVIWPATVYIFVKKSAE